MKCPESFTLKVNNGADQVEDGVTLYFHYPCFDGLVSCVFTWKFLVKSKGWDAIHFCPVNYDYRENWISIPPARPFAVVDFLYHPRAFFWADHHATTFLSEALRADFDRRHEESYLLFDAEAPSCASVLWRRFGALFEENRYREMLFWADKIDSARYTSVAEAIFGEAPALRINSSLALRSDLEYCRSLVLELGSADLHHVAELPEVQHRYEEVMRRREAGLTRMKDRVHLEDGNIVTFDIETTEKDIISRYAPYYFFEVARYSIGVVRLPDKVRITAMRNPWLNFESIPLGKLFRQFGGGGHQRVASVIVPVEQAQCVPEIVEHVKHGMRGQPLAARVVA
jgi:hypothetical protein